MTSNLVLVVSMLGMAGAFIAGLAGIGGAVIMIPLLYYVPPILGLEKLSLQAVAGVTIVQVLVAAGTAAWVHKSHNLFNRSLVVWMGTSIAIGSFAGGLGAKYVSEEVLQFVFAALALLAAVVMFIPRKEASENQEVMINRPLSVTCAAIIGVLSGLIGAGGAFLLVPIMLYLLKIPLRITIGSSLGIVFFSALSGFIGKALTGQIPWDLAFAIIIGALPGAYLGGKVSKIVPVKILKVLLALLISTSAVKMWLNLIY
ncbi:MAG: hypothetical protein JG781_1418 [Peptococcaceae bacterium]|jgi:hypothetical protein|nr:hypothetical protein [Peptococcaceae bacterium]